jgi:hypothetical protein
MHTDVVIHHQHIKETHMLPIGQLKLYAIQLYEESEQLAPIASNMMILG